jgi:diguanylate cyclase (GGDEF)-like protein
MDRVAAAIESHRKRETTVALIFFDIDDFKQVNDSLGHTAGDHLLTVTAQRLQSAVRRGDTVARYGGDEFVVLLEGVQSIENAEALASIITRAVQAPVKIADHEVVPTVSAGLAIANRDIDAEGLLGDADTAMYAAKKSGHATLKIYDTALREMAITKMEIEEGLRNALREGELTVYYQPIVALDSRAVVGYESLVRWSHPRRGFLLPQEFLAVAEQAHLVEPIGSHVIHEACGFVNRHPDFDGRVFINVSPKQIGTAGLSVVLDEAFKDHQVDPSRFVVEITEAGFLKTSLAADADLHATAALGVAIVLDDFGTGYGSLATVLEKPIAGIKLAEEFTRRLGDGGVGDKVSHGIAHLANDIGLLAVVKGVETDSQASIANTHGWTMGQGFLFGHPQSEDSLGLTSIG